MRTNNFLNIAFFITLLMISYAVSAMETTTQEHKPLSLLERATHKKSTRTLLSQVKISAVAIQTLEDALSVDVTEFQNSCDDMYTARSAIEGFLNQMTNYTPEAMEVDIEQLENAKGIVSQAAKNINSKISSLVQLGSKSQLESTLNLMDKYTSMNMIKKNSVQQVKAQIAEYLKGSTDQYSSADLQSVIASLQEVIDHVIGVKSQMFQASNISILDSKRTTLDSMIRSICFNDVDPVVNYTRDDDRDSNIAGNRYYKGWDDDFLLLEDTGVNLTAPLFRDYVIGGWMRWLDYIDYTYDDEEKETVIFRLTSESDNDIEEDKKFADRHAILYASRTYYRFCTHDVTTNDMNVCTTFNISGIAHENNWHFFMFMYSYDTQKALARIRVNGEWTTYDFPNAITQTPTDGIISFYMGHDAFYDMGTVGFNGELKGWNVWYGVNSWQSQPQAWDDDNAETVCNKYFKSPVDVPYVEILLNPNTQLQKQIDDETSQFSFFNTFFEAQDYGFGLWVKLDQARGFNNDDRLIANFGFEIRTDINTPGNSIAALITRGGSLFVRVVYEKNNEVFVGEKELAALYQDEWFFVQVHFSTTDQIVKAWFKQSGTLSTVTFDDVSAIYVPQNVFFTLGYSHILNQTGADFFYKYVWVYAGVQTLYDQPCDSSCKSCNGPNPSDCTDCVDGFFLNDQSICQVCQDDCEICGGCGSGQCTKCKDGKVLVNGNCYCDSSCQTCNGITSHDCLSCSSDTQILVNGKCVDCDDSCKTCNDSGPSNCTDCFDGFQLNFDGRCVPVCNNTKCKSCVSNSPECAECNDPFVLFNGDCVECDASCLTCSGPYEFQCLTCTEPAQIIDGKCITCHESCLTCDGPDDDDCLTCASGLILEGCKCLQPCDYDNGFYRDSSNNCQPCDSSCQTCKDSSSCTTCDSEHLLVNGTCVLPPTPGPECNTTDGYILVKGVCIQCNIDNGQALINDQCINCDPSCKTCFGPDNDNCITCANSSYILSNGKCQPEAPICDPNQGYVIDENGNCVKCQQNCTTCVAPDTLDENNNCVSPPPPECPVSDGFVLLPDGSCVPCDDSCLTCSDVNSNNCLSCLSPLVFNPNTNTCDNPCDVENGYVLLPDGTCSPCDSTCLTCSGTSSDNCLTCDKTRVFNPNTNTCDPICDVDNGFVLLPDGTCAPCDSSCLTCSGVNNNNCLSCDNTTVLNPDTNTCDPPCDTNNGNVLINGQCYPCDKSCLTCTGTSSKDCIECTDNLTMVAGECVEPCDTDNGFVLIAGQCLPCDESCLTCSGTSNADCTSCPDGLVLQGGTCVKIPDNCDVENGYIYINNQCIPCDPSCKTCDGLSNNDCTDCFDGATLSAGSCIVPTPDCNITNGQILINGKCYDCDSSCLTCSGVEDTDCIDCVEGRVMEGGKCVVPCDVQNGFYEDNGACLPCDKSCQTCHGSDIYDCDSCPDGYFIDADGKCQPANCVNEDYYFTESNDHTCKDDCDCDGTRRCSPDGECHDCLYLSQIYPSNYTSTVCPVCNDSCVTCRGSRSNDCWSCHDHEFLSNGSCLPCDDSCLTCNGTTDQDCTSCDSNMIYNDGKCRVPCDEDNGFFYATFNNCLPCDKSCQTCHGSNPGDCDTCANGLNFSTNGLCLPPCDTDNGFYLDENQVCQPCDDTCQKCDGPDANNCTSCPVGYFFEFGKCNPSNCVSYDYIFNETNINECNSDCECDGTRRCNPARECEDCNTLVKEFPEQYTSDVCPPCDPTCETCRGPNENDCNTCPLGYFFDSGKCTKCDSSCTNCTGPSTRECTDCDATHVLMNGQCVQPCDTEDGFYYDSDLVCQPCYDECKTCHNSNQDGCDSCYSPYTLENNICKPPCDFTSGYIYDASWNCVPCTEPCALCSAVGDDQCTACSDGFSLFDGRCVNCISFYYSYDESTSSNGPSQCSSDCECDNTRRCGPDGVCQDCLTLSNEWPSIYDEKDCPPCNSSCLTCNGPTSLNCTTCVDGEYLGVDGGCYPCDDTCKTCDGPGNTECTSCESGLFLVDGECTVPPAPCDSSCLTCDGPNANNCTSCGDDYNLVDGECIHKDCINWNYVFDEANSSLGPNRCDDDCECDGTRRCSPDKYCAECLDLVTLFPDIYDLKDCPPCDQSCSTCFGADANSCSSCPSGFYLTDSNACEPCDNNCAQCSGTATNCTDCAKEFVLDDNNVCVIPCDPSCLTCSGPTSNDCLNCTEEKTLVNGQCIVTPVCVKLDYVHDESTNILGPNMCINDCDCDNTRRCSPNGICRDCMYLATLYPDSYNASDCPPCDITCLTCEGPSDSNCTACPDGRVLIGGNCELCDTSCLTCNDVDDQHCLTCPDDKILSNGQCVNPPPICDKTCLECSGPNPSDCTKCQDNWILTSDGYCEEPNCVSWNYSVVETDGRCENDCDCDGSRRCSPDKYCQECDDLASAYPSLYSISDCPPCDSTCFTCNGPSDTDCISCPPLFALVNGQCLPCDKTCATCVGTTADDCTSCPQGLILDGSQCVNPPPVCDESCYNCTGPLPNQCTDCYPGYQLAWDNTCEPIENCVKWGYSHDESTNALGASRCYGDCDCDNSRRCSPNGYCRECVDLANTYPNIYSLSDCPVCDKSCLTCDGPNEVNCTTCADGFVLVEGSCLPCNTNCLTCSNSPDDCTSCEDGYILNGTTCVQPPPNCTDPNCLQCSSPDQCIVCANQTQLTNGQCLPINCIAFDYVFDEEDNSLGAHRCDSDCDCNGTRRCSPDKYCGECFDLVDEFPTIYAFSDCPVCDKSCKSCDGPTDQDCTSCDDGFVLVNGTCQPCDSSCDTCQDTTSKGCISCPAGYDLQTDGTCTIHYDCDKTCETCNGPNRDQCTSCPDGRVLQNGQCLLQCVYYDYVFEENPDGSCKDDCDCDGTRRCSPSGTCDDCSDLIANFPNVYDSNDCPPCDKSCDHCRGPSATDCTSCPDGQYLADDGSCQPCDKSCETCDGPDENQCNSCYNNQVIVDGYCVDPNPVCDSSCLTCNDVGPHNCTSCYDGYDLVNNTCVPIDCYAWDYSYNELLAADGPHRCEDDCQCSGNRLCSPAYWCMDCLDAVAQFPYLFDASLCLPCDSSCYRCSGPTYLECTECLDNEVLINGQCFPCDASCATCFDIGNDSCSTCPQGKQLNDNHECVNPPPVCDASCNTCFGPTANNCSSCNDNTSILLNSTCINPNTCNTPDYYFDEEPNNYECNNDCECSETRMCSPLGYCHECRYLAINYPNQFNISDCPPCDPSCLTCDGPTNDSCLSCDDGFYLTKDYTCEPCDSSCLTCYEGDSISCLTCEDPLVLNDGSCEKPNPVCDPSCLTCKGPLPTDCLSCPDYVKLTDDNTCEPINCVDFNYVHDELLNSEGPHECTTDCECNGARRCSPSGYCEDCLSLAELYPGTFLASDCPPCDKSCLLCDGPSEQNCTTCPDGISLFNGQCIECDKECLTCFGPNRDNCLSCPLGQVLFQQQCFTPNSTCDSSCVTCDGPNPDQCTSCPCDHNLVDGACVPNIIECDESCLTCWGTAANQCRTCDAGKVLLAGGCVTVSSFFGMRTHEEEPISYKVANKYTTGSDIGLGSWIKFNSFVPKEYHRYNLLFRLSGMTADDKANDINKYRSSSLAVYYNDTHYTFETYSKASGTPVLVQKSIPMKKNDMENKWNLVFFGYSRKHSTASGFVKLPDGTHYEVNFNHIYQDVPSEKMEVFFYGDNNYNGFNGAVSSPEVLHGNNFLQGFSDADHETYFKLDKQ